MNLAHRIALAALVTIIVSPAMADELAIGFGPGGAYDRWGRLVARHLGKHAPGSPTFVPKNMPGAGSVKAANYIYSVAPKDGTSIGIIGRDVPMLPLTGASGADFDPRKFNWIGSPSTETSVCVSYKTSPVKTLQDLQTHELVLGSVGLGTGTYIYPKVLSELFNMKFKIIGGYRSSVEAFLAMERGEVQGICESLNSLLEKRPDWIKTGTVSVLFSGGLAPNPELKNFPFVLDIAKNEEQRQLLTFLYAGQAIGRPFIAPPGLADGKAGMLRKAFDDTMKDPEFTQEAEKGRFDVSPVNGEQIETVIKQVYATPKSLIDRISAILANAK